MPHLPVTHAVETELLNIQGVNSVGRGLINGQDALIIGITTPDIQSQIEQLIQQRFGTTIQGVQYEVRVIGEITPQQITVPREIQQSQEPQRTNRFRPVPMGVSIGHENITAGTSGFLLTDGNIVYAGSNNHVFAQVNQANAGDPILQPGPIDGGTAGDTVAQLQNYVPIQDGATVDMAWAVPTDVEFVLETEGIDIDVIDSVIVPQPGDTLIKTGRTTGVTTGTVDQVGASVNVNYGGEHGMITMTDQLITTDMSDGGDSGSAAFIETSEGLQPAGCVFAGSSTITVLNTAENWINESDLDILPAGGTIIAGFDTNLAGLAIGGAIGGAILHDALL